MFHGSVDDFIGPLVLLSESYIRDSTHMINTLNNLNTSPCMLLCTLDISSLYTNIPHNEGTQAIKKFLAIHRDTNVLPHNSYIIELLEVVLTNTYFDFNAKHYHQKSGTAMGTKLAPSYANLFITKFEKIYVYTYHLSAHTMEKIYRWHFHDMASWHGFTIRIHPTFKYCTPNNQIHKQYLSIRNSISGPYNIQYRWQTIYKTTHQKYR